MFHAPRTRQRAVARFLGAAITASLAVTLFAPTGSGSLTLSGGPAHLLNAASDPAQIDPALQLVVDSAAQAGAKDSPSANTSSNSAEEAASTVSGVSEDWVDQTSGTVEIMVFFDDPGVAPSAQGDPELAAASLQHNAETHWERVDRALEDLERAGAVEVLNRFWVTSAVLVQAENSEETLRRLAEIPGATSVVPNYTVEGLAEEEPLPLSSPTIATNTVSESLTDEETLPVAYGIETIRADDAWRDFGAEGQGVRVAVLDTGVDATHPDIGSRLVGRDSGDPSYPGGWINFDRSGNPIVSKPTDPGSHGTHVAGTVLGGAASGTRVGVAPAAELMAANVLSGGGSTAKILAALEWVIEPYDGQGNPAGRAADVINMSLGSGAYDASLIQPLRNLRDAGIFPAIAIGNAPCGVNGTSSPGDIYEAFGVGMTNSADEVNSGSCGAVTNWPTATAERYGWPDNFVKPDASAPGTAVFSAMPGGLWGEATGTSMATPHVAGAVALIRSAQGGLSIDQIEQALESTAWHPDPASAPDTRYGHGRIDVHAAIASVLGESGVSGVIHDSVTGEPVAGAEVSYGEHGETWTTDEQGRFTARLVPGTYTLQVTRFGFEPLTSEAVEVAESGFVELDLALTAITVGAIAGIVVDHRTAAPIAGATVTVMGQPISTLTAADGSYHFENMPVGAYRVRAEAPGMRESISSDAEVRAALSTTVNFQLAALQRVLVLGDNGGRTSALIAENGFVAETLSELPADMHVLTDYDAVLWDTPNAASAAQLQAAIEATDASGTGIIWLDLGASDNSGIANLSRELGVPAARGSGNDRELVATGYRVVAEHDIFAGGILSAEGLHPGSLLLQNSASSGPKFFAWFSELTGTSPVVLAETIVRRTGESGDSTVTDALGHGIAVDQRANNRHVYLALHGSSTAVDARSWSLASVQLLLNTVSWASPETTQAPEPVIIVPETPVVPPGDGGNGGVTPKPGGGTDITQTTSSGALASAQTQRTQTTQPAAKPEGNPAAPVSAFNQLTSGNAGGVTLREEGGIAHVTIPGSNPGDWFFLHVYPGALAVDWIRVNDDGELRIDVARLPSGDYRFAFTTVTGELVGWVSFTVSGADTAAAPGIAEHAAAGVAPAVVGEGGSGFSLSLAEQIMLMGAALILLAAAGVVLVGMRRSGAASAAAAVSGRGAEAAPGSPNAGADA